MVDLLREEPPAIREAVVPWIQEMCRGMAEFAGRQTRSLQTEDELDRYCYYVAGTVGHLLTALFVVQRERITPEAGHMLAPRVMC